MAEFLDTSDIETLVRMVFMDESVMAMMEKDGKVEGQIGETHLFKAYPEKRFPTLHRIDIRTMADEPVESFIFHRHSNKVPPNRPGKSMEVYRIDDRLLNGSQSSRAAKRSLQLDLDKPERRIDAENIPLKVVLKM